MKKLFTSLIAVVATMLVGISPALAEDYDLWVAGVHVTSSNASNITGMGVKSGKVTYDASSKKLVLTDAVLETSGTSDGIYNKGINGLSIRFEGTCKITTNSSGDNVAGIFCSKPTTFTSLQGVAHPVVTISNTGAGPAIKSYDGSSISIWGLQITAKSSNYAAIYASSAAALNVYFSRIDASAPSGKAALTGFKSGLNLNQSGTPSSRLESGFTFNTSSGAVYKNGSLAESFSIKPALTIGNHYVGSGNTINKANTGATSFSGTVTYDASSKTLSLNGATLEGVSIDSYVPGLKIESTGTCTIKNSGSTVYAEADLSFTGAGTLNLTSTSYSGISVYNGAKVTMNMTKLVANGKKYGFWGLSNGELLLQKYSASTSYQFVGEECNVLTGKLTMENVDIWTPKTYFDASSYKMFYNGSVATKTNGPASGTWFNSTNQFTYYDLYVGGTRVNDRNASGIYPPYLTSGSVTYDNSTKTLTLDNAVIKGQTETSNIGANNGIRSSIDGLTIATAGTVSITTAANAIDLGYSAKIIGSGSFNVTSTEGHGINLFANNNTNLTLQRYSGTMVVTAKKNAYYGYKQTELIVNKNGTSGSLYEFLGETGNIVNTGLNMGTGVNIWSAYTWFNDDEKAVYFKDAVAKGTNMSNQGTWIRGDVTWTEAPVEICGQPIYYSYDSSQGLYRGNVNFYCKNLKSGSITYNPDSKTLSFSAAKLDLGSANMAALRNKLSGLTITLYSTNSITCNAVNYSSVVFEQNTTLTTSGSGKLNIDGSGTNICIYNDKELTLADGVEVTLSNRLWSRDDAAKLTVKNSKIDIQSIYGKMGNITLADGAGYAIPNNGTFNSTSKVLSWNNSDYTGRVLIQPLESYEVYLAGIQANSYNYNDIFADPMYQSSYGKSGTAKYSKSGSTLQLEGVNITAPINIDAVEVLSDNVTLQLRGENSLSASGNGNAIWAKHGITIKGEGSSPVLNATNTRTDLAAILFGNSGTSKASTISGLTVNSNGLTGQSGTTLNINDATVNLSGFTAGTIEGFADVILGAGLNYFKPAGASYDTALKSLKANDNMVTGEVQIAQGDTYPLTIAGIEVNSANASNITGAGISGSVKYDNATKTLTLNNVTISKTGTEAIATELSELNIVLEGTNKFENGNSFGSIRSTGDINISGSGSLTTSYNINVKGDMEIENTTLTVNGRLRGAYVGSSSELYIKNSNVTVNPGSMEPITEWGYFTLDGCAITTPAGAEFSSADGGLFVGSTMYKGNLVIEPAEDLGITIVGIPVNSKNKDNIVSPYITSGKVSVGTTGANPVITLDNVTIDYSAVNNNPIYISDLAENVIIELKGNNTIKTQERAAIYYYGDSRNYTIRGNNSTITTDCYFCTSSAMTCNLTIEDATINGMSIYNFNTVKIKNSTLNLKGDNTYGTIEGINNLVFEGCDITEPVGAEFLESIHAVGLDGSLYMGDVKIEPMKKFGITIAGVTVTDLNADDVLGDGKVRWNATSGRLTLSGDNFGDAATDGIVIDGSALSNVQIEVIGNNTLNAQDGIKVSGGSCNVTIYSADGTGKLIINAANNGVDNVNRLAFRDVQVLIKGDQIGVRGGTLDIQTGAIVGIQAITGTNALKDVANVEYAANMIVADGGIDQQKVAFGEDYGFSLNDMRMTSYLLANSIGTVYDPASKTITVDNLVGEAYIDNEKCDGLTLKVSGANAFNAGDHTAIRTAKPMIIDGTGTLAINSNVVAINATADITIKGGVSVSITGGTNAYDGNNTSTLHVDNCVFHAYADGQVFKDMADIDLIGISVSEPANAVIDGGTVKVDGTPVSGATVAFGDVKSYGIDVAGIGITTVNAGSVEGSDITRGTVSYDDGTKTLTLNNVEINGTIQLEETVSDIINIQLIGENIVTAEGKAFFTKEGGFRFFSDGTGSLSITASGLSSSAIEAKKAITFDNCLVIADGGERGFSGVTQDCVVTVDNAAVRVRGSQSCVAGMKNIVLANGVQANPTADNKAIKVNDFGTKIEYASSGDVVRDTWVDLSEPYNMWIGATLLTRAVVYSGTATLATGVNYNHATRTLTLENATIDGVWNASGQVINVVIDGDCTINSSAFGTGTKKPAIYAGADVNITANTTTSTLLLDGGSFSPAILGEGEATVTIANHLTAIAKGMRGVYSEDKKLTLVVNTATLTAQGTQQSISGLKALVMTGCGITAPTSAAFNEATGAVELNGSAVSGQPVTIDPSGDGIDGLTADDANIDGIYSVDGKRLGRTQSGVNIVRKSDGSVVKVLRK